MSKLKIGVKGWINKNKHLWTVLNWQIIKSFWLIVGQIICAKTEKWGIEYRIRKVGLVIRKFRITYELTFSPSISWLRQLTMLHWMPYNIQLDFNKQSALRDSIPIHSTWIIENKQVILFNFRRKESYWCISPVS